ncbi:hypothetical protein ACK3YE_19550 [Aeromonas allosaccharophila]
MSSLPIVGLSTIGVVIGANDMEAGYIEVHHCSFKSQRINDLPMMLA